MFFNHHLLRGSVGIQVIFKSFREIVRYENRSLNCLLNVFLDGLAGYVHYMKVRMKILLN